MSIRMQFVGILVRLSIQKQERNPNRIDEANKNKENLGMNLVDRRRMERPKAPAVATAPGTPPGGDGGGGAFWVLWRSARSAKEEKTKMQRPPTQSILVALCFWIRATRDRSDGGHARGGTSGQKRVRTHRDHLRRRVDMRHHQHRGRGVPERPREHGLSVLVQLRDRHEHLLRRLRLAASCRHFQYLPRRAGEGVLPRIAVPRVHVRRRHRRSKEWRANKSRV
jgi:hypothetical protein